MSKYLIAGNWKMNSGIRSTAELANSLNDFVLNNNSEHTEVLICPPYINISTALANTDERLVKVGAQNCHYKDSGAYTGEISPVMLREVGCTHVILGHSERREYFNEHNEMINFKIKSALTQELIPILCIGEKLEERRGDETFDILSIQLSSCLANIEIEDIAKIVIAYEPVWAIGTGVSATTEEADEAHKWIRTYLVNKFGKKAEDIKILYGGSMNEVNAKELLELPEVNGGLIGGASLKFDSFSKIISIANTLSI